MANKLRVVKANDGYEALYKNNSWVDEGNPLNQGEERLFYFLRTAETFGVNPKDIEFSSEDFWPNFMEEWGTFPDEYDFDKH